MNQTKALVTSKTAVVADEITRMVMELPANVQLGVSPGYMVEMAGKFSLTAEDVATIISIRRDYNAIMGYVGRLLALGATVEQIHAAYAARESIGPNRPISIRRDEDEETMHTTTHAMFTGVSLIAVIEFLECFPDSLVEPEMTGGVLADICERVIDFSDSVQDQTSALRALCSIANEREGISVEGAIAILTGKGFKFLDDSDDDEESEE